MSAPPAPGRLLRLAELQLAIDQLTMHIADNERVRQTIDERIAEDKADRALLAHELRELRGPGRREHAA